MIAKVIINENHRFSEDDQWKINEICQYITNTEKFYLALVSHCKQAMSKIHKGHYDESHQIETIIRQLVIPAIHEYRRTLDKTNTFHKKHPIEEAIRYRIAYNIFNREMENLGFTKKIRSGIRL